MSMASNIHELKRLQEVIEKAEKKGHLIKHTGISLIFTPEGLVEAINKGAWHACKWEVVSKRIYGNMLRSKLKDAQKEYDDFVKLIEK